MQKKVLVNALFVISLIFLSSIVVFGQSNNTNFDVKPSFEWLIQSCADGWCGSVEATSFYAMSMKLAGYANTYGAQAIKQIKLEQKEDEGCFPKGSCNVRDTSLAYWVLSNYGEDTSGIEDYIKTKLGSGLTDNWWLAIITTAENQKCKIGYPLAGNQEEKEILVDKGKFPECNVGQPKTFFDLNKCISPNLVNSNPNLELTIDCSSIGQGTIISIIYNSGSSYYIAEQATTSKYKTQIQNACHKKGNTCDKDVSLWTNWVLKQKNSDINTNLYLLTVYDNLDPVDASLLYMAASEATTKSGYLNTLLGLQKLDGSFNKNNYETGVAILALNVAGSVEELNNAIEYLKKSRNSDGSWDSDKLTTSLVLYSAFADASVNLPPMSGGSNFGPGLDSFCGDGVCDPDESEFSCFKDCQDKTSDVCVVNNICESDYGETSLNCAADCSCGDGICDSSELTSCISDCGESNPKAPICGNNIREGSEECDGLDDSSCLSGFSCSTSCICTPEDSDNGFNWGIILTILIILVVIAGVYLGYRYYSPRKKSPIRKYPSGSTISLYPRTNTPFGEGSKQQKSISPGTATRTASRKSNAELELEKSLREARKLLGGK